MQSVYKLVSTVNQFYREINPSTLSGAIDVIVVEQPNGELACSPFHVRFGKLLVLRPQEKKVSGEAFFVFETENRVPKELQTSPLAGPSDPLPTEEEPDFLDLNTDNSKDILQNRVEQNNTIDFGTDDGYEGDSEPKILVAEPKSIHEMNSELPSVITDLVIPMSEEETITDEKAILISNYEKSNKTMLNGDTVHEADEKLAPGNQDIKLESNCTSDSISLIDDVTEYKPESLEKLYFKSDAKQAIDEDANLSNKVDGVVSGHEPELLNGSADNLVIQNNVESDLAQLSDVIKTQQTEESNNIPRLETEASRQNRERALSIPSVHPKWEKSEGPFSDTELEETRKPEKPLERRPSRTSPLSDTELEYGPQKPSKDSEEWSWVWGALPVRTSEKITHWQNGTVDKDWKDDNTIEKPSGIEIGGKVHHFEMSLCGSEAFGRDEPLPDSTMTNLSSNRLEELRSSDQRRYSLRGWSRWWSRSSSPLPIEASEKIDKEPKDNVEKENEKPTKFYAKTLRLTSEQLKSLNLKKGANTITFSVPSSYQGKATCVAKIFFWDCDTKIVISDIDGTITKSDALGHVFTMIGKDWTHSGVAKLYTDIRKNGYQILYLTSRAIGQAGYTRDYLKKVEQDKYQLPDGPVIMSPDRLLTAFHREVIMRKPEVFKMACLRDVQKLFCDRNPFFAGFGNRITDALSYRSVNVPSSRIFTIDTNGEVKLQL
ncbi:10420_t:CDS:10, partial [Funneliformis mosseae]